MTKMDRRNVLLTAVGATAVAVGASEAKADDISERSETNNRPVAADGTRLFHRTFGPGPRTLVFCASWGLDSRMWDYQVTHFADLGFRCVSLDRRGHGRSDVPATGYDMDTFADDIAVLIEQLYLNDVVLVGHSMGCAEIIRFVARHGTRRVARIALIAPLAPYLLQTADNAYGAPREFFESVWAQYAADFPKWAYANQPAFFTPATSEALKEALTRQLLDVPVPIAIATQRALITTDLRGDLAKIDRPVLILHGDHDVSAPLAITGERVAAGVSSAELKVYQGAPHGIWVTHLDQVNRDLAAFASAG